MRGRPGLVVLAVVLASCQAPAPPQAISVGEHRIEVRVPEGWEHLDHGLEHRFEKAMAQISVADLGPAVGAAFQNRITYARELFRRGQLEDARTVLTDLRVRRAFQSLEQWNAFLEAWENIRRAGSGRNFDPVVVERYYTEAVAQIGALPSPDLSTIGLTALEELGHDERRDVAEREVLIIDGREALRIDTWDRLSHDFRMRHVLIINEGNLLVARMDFGQFDEMEQAFDAIIDSLAFPPTGGAARAGRAEPES